MARAFKVRSSGNTADHLVNLPKQRIVRRTKLVPGQKYLPSTNSVVNYALVKR